MRGIPSSFLLIFFISVFLIELIAYYGMRMMSNRISQKLKFYLSVFYIVISVITTSLLLYSFANPEVIRQARNYNLFYLVVSFSILNLFPKFIYAIITLLSLPVRWLGNQRMHSVVLAGSFVICTGLFALIAYGILWGRNNLQVEKKDLYIDQWPEQLNGFTIVQLSDIHLGTFGNDTHLMEKTTAIVNRLNPDLLLFTGDLVNNFSEEIKGFEPYLEKLHGRYGKYAILGNHDYGDYSNWPDAESKRENFEQLKNQITASGFILLLNQWQNISVKDTSFALIGVENWGHAPFPKYANLDEAMKGIPSHAVKILMSHDPAHWSSIVIPQTDIPLTLSGHTHGAQMGIKVAGIEFSPMYFIQKNWGGLYKKDNQLLYVNTGLGTIGFKGRIDMRPEITLLTIYRTKSH